jgi:hypothetical protein
MGKIENRDSPDSPGRGRQNVAHGVSRGKTNAQHFNRAPAGRRVPGIRWKKVVSCQLSVVSYRREQEIKN